MKTAVALLHSVLLTADLEFFSHLEFKCEMIGNSVSDEQQWRAIRLTIYGDFEAQK